MKIHATPKSKKLLLVLGAIFTVAVIIAATVFTTVAYLTSNAYVTNPFTIGSVGITLTETTVNAEGMPVDRNGEVTEDPTQMTQTNTGNNYHLVPNKTYMKDPTITVAAGSEASYLFIVIANGIEAIECSAETDGHDAHPTIKQQLAACGWKFVEKRSTGDVYVYVGTEGTDAKSVTAGSYKLFNNFTISSQSSATIANYATANITINALAIQAATLTEATAWETLVSAYGYIVGTPAT